MTSREAKRRALGRPRKFDENSRVITVTLPESTLQRLAALNQDRARAIVQTTELALGRTPDAGNENVEMVAVTSANALITMPFSLALSEIADVELVSIGADRYLILLKPGTPLSKVEVALLDKLESLGPGREEEGQLLRQLLERLRVSRRSERLHTREIILVNL